VGVVLGSLVFARSPKRGLGALLTGGTLAMGLAYIAFSAAGSLEVACLAAVLGGVGNGVEWASVISIVQRLTPPDLHGRLMSAVESIGALALALGLSLGGALVALSSPRGAFLVVGIGATAMTFAFLRLVLGGLDHRTTADAQTADAEEPPTQPDDASTHTPVPLVQADSATPVPALEHLKSDAASVVKYDKD
jgi:MFS family permease